MNQLSVSPLLRRALRLDAVASLLVGAAMSVFVVPLQTLLALPLGLLLGAGLFAVVYGAVLWQLSRRGELRRGYVWTIIVGNGAWAAACLWLAFGGLLAPSGAGVAFLVLQAAVVFGFAELQFFGMRRQLADEVPPSAAGVAARP